MLDTTCFMPADKYSDPSMKSIHSCQLAALGPSNILNGNKCVFAPWTYNDFQAALVVASLRHHKDVKPKLSMRFYTYREPFVYS